MPRLEPPPEDFRRVLREKALSHSLFYLKLGAGVPPGQAREASAKLSRRASDSTSICAPTTARVTRHAQPRVSELLRKFEPGPMQYLRIPRAASPPEDISSSDDDDRAAVRRRSRDLSDDSAVELEPRRRHSHPRDVTPPPDIMSPRRERTLIEANVVELGRRGSEGCETRGRCVRTPSVVVSDYSDGVAVGATEEEVDWLRSRSLSADSACSSCSTLSSRDDEEFESPKLPKKNFPATARRMADFFGKTLSNDQVTQLAHHFDFNNFKKNKSVNCENLQQCGIMTKDGAFIRKGKAGGWREYFDEEMTAQADEWIASRLRDTDLRFPNT